MNDEELRAAYRSAAITSRPRDRAHCPTPDALAALVDKRGPEPERLVTLDHVMSCSACRQEFELLRAIDTGARREGAVGTRKLSRWQRPLALALAASLVLAVGLGPGRDWLSRERTDALRGAGDAVQLVLPAADAAVARDSVRFVWRPVTGALRYTVELLTNDGAVRLAATTSDTSVALPDARDAAAGEYRWWVRAELSGGEQRSEARAIRLRAD